MAMFDDNFSFDTPRSPSLDLSTNTLSTREPSRSVSPCSTTSPFPQPRFSVTDLAAVFATSRLRNDSQIYYDPCDAYANTDDDLGWEIPTQDIDFPPVTRANTFPQRPRSPPSRMQRQTNTRLLCSVSHARDIASLVARMVDCQEQCNVATSATSSPTSEDDEGYNSEETSSTPSGSRRASIAIAKSRLNYRRSSDVRTTGACVSKSVRLRKGAKSQRRPRNSESDS